MRSARRAAAVLVLSVLLVLVGGVPAWAHDALIGSTPAAGTTVDSSPATVTLEFSDVVQNLGPLVTVVGPNGDHWEGEPVTVKDNTVTAPVHPLGPAGTYTVSYRIVSADGHPVEGSFAFTLGVAGGGTPNPETPEQEAASDSIPAWVWILGASVVLLVIVLVGVRGTLRRKES